MIERHRSGGPWEARVGYCRVVRAGDGVHVAGCTGVRADGSYAEDAAGQLRDALVTVGDALALAGAGFADVVRTRLSVVDVERDADAIGAVHAEAFGAHPPVAAMIGVARLLDPRMLVEIEVDAWAPRRP